MFAEAKKLPNEHTHFYFLYILSVRTHFRLKFGSETGTNQTSGALPAAAASNEAAAGALGLQEMARGTPSNTRRNGLQCGGGRGTEPAGDEATAGSEGSAMSRVYYGLSFFYLQKLQVRSK